MKWRNLAALSAATILALTASLTAAPVGASGGRCWVKNLRTKVVVTDLQSAVTQPGDVLRVRGVCGAFTAPHTVTLLGPATLTWPDCEECGASVVLTVDPGAKVTLKHIALTNGSSTYYGGSVLNYGTLVLRGRTSVTGNRAEDGGGGIYNEGRLVMAGVSSVTGNSLLYGYGGGVWNVGTMVMKDHALVARNTGVFGGGIYNSGLVVMRDHAGVKANTAETGGGVFSTGTLLLKGRSKITRNTAISGPGGGILSEGGTVRFSPTWRGSVCGNSPDDWSLCTS